MKATAEIGRMGIEFKVNAALAQYRTLKNPPAGTRAGRQSGTVRRDGGAAACAMVVGVDRRPC